MQEIKEYVDESGILLTKKVIAAGVSKQLLYRFLRENGFEQVGHGVYASSEAWNDANYILSLRCPNAVFSHDEALYYHGLVDREPMMQTITIYTGYGTARLVKDGITVYTVKKELLEVGKTEGQTSLGHKVPIYDMERTVCDLIRSRNRFEAQDFQSALRAYVGKKDKNLNRLMRYAALFHVERKLQEYMEVLLP